MDRFPMRALVVDDEALARRRLSRMLRKLPDIAEVQECVDGKDAVAMLETRGFDLALLDVRMRTMDGFEVIEQVGYGSMPPVIFVTAFDDFAIRAFDVQAVDYLVKPVSSERLEQAVHRTRHAPQRIAQDLSGVLRDLASEARSRSAARKWVMIRDQGQARLIPSSEIAVVSAAGNYVYLETTRRKTLHRESMSSLESRLDPNEFVRIHRSTIVNIDFIEHLEPTGAGDYQVTMRTGQKVRLSRTYRDAFMAVFEADE
jgi:two-component system LytT family response regulator